MPLVLFLTCVVFQTACGGGSDDPWSAGPGLSAQGISPSQPSPTPSPSSLTCPAYNATSSPFPPQDLSSPFPTAAAGTIPGAFSVTATGEATYTMPLVVPPGRAGMEPSLAITYDSAGGNGILGAGFALAGMSAITRCPSNIAQDGRIREVRYDDDDRFCIDGKRLVTIQQDGGTALYRTFPDTFTKIVRHLGSPQSFDVYLPSGLHVEYGTTADSKVWGNGTTVRSWLAARATDRRGNFIAYEYNNARSRFDGHTVEHTPSAVRYTGFDDGTHKSAPRRAVEFEYEDKDPGDVRTLYTGGMTVRSSQRLAHIWMRGPGGALVREYRFGYGSGPGTGRTILTSVRECAPDNICKPATRFWFSGAKASFQPIKTYVSTPLATRASPMLLDVTGDGLDDFVIPDVVDMSDPLSAAYVDPGFVKTYWNVARNRGTSTLPFTAAASAKDTASHVASAPEDLTQVAPELGTALDYDQDGRTDIFLHDIYGADKTWFVLLAQPNGSLARHDTGITRPAPGGVSTHGVSAKSGSVHLADVDGDGVPDLIQCEDKSPTSVGANDYRWELHLWKPTGPGWKKTGTAIDLLYRYPCNSELHTVDINADGKIDLVVRGAHQVDNDLVYHLTYAALSRRETGAWTSTPTVLPTSSQGLLRFLDVNGDGLPDAVEADQSHQLVTYINTGDGFALPVNSLPSPVIGGADAYFHLAASLDYNGDGRADLLVPMPPGVLPNGSTVVPSWVVLQSRGAGFVVVDPHIPFEPELGENGITIANPHGPRVTDINGDGAQDVVLALAGQYTVFKSLAADQDLLTKVADGMNDHAPSDPGFVPSVFVAYEHLVDRSVTDAVPQGSAALEGYGYVSRFDELNACAYPRHCAVGPRRVVQSYAINNGADKLRTFVVKYRDGRFDRLGRGFLGFGSRVVVDLDTHAGREEVFDNKTHNAALRAYPYAGHVVHERRWSPGLASQPNPAQIEMSFTDVDLTVVKAYGADKTYFTMPTRRRVRQVQGHHSSNGSTHEQYAHKIEASESITPTSDTTTLIADHDTFGNVLAEHTMTAGVDLTTTTTRTYANDTSKWLIGLLKTESACSKAAGLTKCRTTEAHHDVYGQVYWQTIGSVDNNPETKLTLSFKRDAYGNVVRTTASDGLGNTRASCVSYEPEGIFPFAHMNALGHVTYAKFHPGLGVMTMAVDPNNFVTQRALDGFGRVTKERGSDKTTTTYEVTRKKDGGPQHDAWRVRLATVTDGGADSTVEYDSLGRSIRWFWHGPQIAKKKCATCPAVFPSRLMQRVVFDDLGEHVARRSLPASELTDESALLDDVYEYDAVGRVVTHTAPWGAETRLDYFPGFVQTRDPLGALTVVDRDPLGRTLNVIDKVGGVTSYGYGPFGAARTVTAPDNTVTTITQDAWGRVIQIDDPDRGTTISHHNGFGDLTSSTDAADRTVALAYDALGRLATRTDKLQGAITGTTSWTWDTAPRGTAPNAKALGLLAKTTSPDGQRTYAYDSIGRLEANILTVDGEHFRSRLSYDSLGRVATITYPTTSDDAPFAVEHGYDAYGHLVSVRDQETLAPYWRFTDVDGAGRIRGETFGNDVITTRDYHADKQRLKSIFTTNGSAILQNLSYDYDTKLNLASRRDALQVQHKTERFRYDALDRLTCAYFNETATKGGPCAVSYSYNAIGNLTTKSDVSAAPYVYDPDHPHAVASAGGADFAYDAVGNQIERSGAAVTYTPFDLPKTITAIGGAEVTLDYDGDQRRIRKSVAGGDVTVYFGDLYERVAQANGMSEQRFYVHSAERAVAVVTRAEGEQSAVYLHVDNLGSVDVLTDDGGALKEKRSYDAFGRRRSSTWGSGAAPPASETTRGFTGHEDESDLGLVNMKGRIYDPKIGRFLTPDPIVSRPLSGQSWNPYSYVLNNPLKYVDPSGFYEAPPVDPEWHKDPEVQKILAAGCKGAECRPPTTTTTTTTTTDENQDTSQSLAAGAARAPNDTGTLGSTSGQAAQSQVAAVSGQSAPSWYQRANTFAEGFNKSIREMTLGMLGVSFPVYGAYRFGAGLRAGYKDDGAAGAVNSVNPLYAFGVAVADVVIGVEEHDDRRLGSGAGTLFGMAATVAAGGWEASEGALGEGAAAGAARGAGGGGQRLALGLSEHLDAFATKHGATTWKSFPDPLRWRPMMVERLADPNVKILFDLDGVDVWPGVSRAARGAGGATDWELLQIRQNPQWWSTIEWWKGGEQVPNPFQ